MLVVLHELEKFVGCFTAMGEAVGEVDERKFCNGNEICQVTKGSNAGLFDRKSTFDVLEKDVDLPAVVVGVGGEMVVDTLGSALDAIACGERMSFRREVIDAWRE
ncbi:MAG: hypothetical protein MSB12_07535 [Lentisphaeraceae bacterium]|nr:hypothetical protein [Lentisphaeraceae bacterium]